MRASSFVTLDIWPDNWDARCFCSVVEVVFCKFYFDVIVVCIVI